MKNKFILTSILFCSLMNGFTQSNCVNPENVTGAEHFPVTNEDFIPNETTLVKELRLKFIIIQNTNKPNNGNFENNAETIKFFEDAINNLNYRYLNIITDASSGCEAPVPPSSKIAFTYELEFVIDPTLDGNNWDNPETEECPGILNWDLDDFLSEENSYINIFLTEKECNFDYLVSGGPECSTYTGIWCSEKANYVNLNDIVRINIRSLFSDFYHKKNNVEYYQELYDNELLYFNSTEPSYNINNMYWWMVVDELGGGLAHELGHCFRFDNIFDPSQTGYCNNTNIMGNFGSARNYLTEDQIGQINKIIHLSSLRQYVAECPIDVNNPIIINGFVSWQYDIRLYSDLLIKTGASLTINCKVNMPTDSKIIIERGARLVIDGGTITKSCDGLWQGIEVYGAGNLVAHPTRTEIINGTHPMTSSSHGVLYIKNGGTIEYARNGITTSKYDDYYNTAYYGGVVLATNANFINNKRTVEFLPYNYNNIIGPDDNVCEFYDCTFEVNDNYLCSEAFSYHATMYNVHGVDFLGCKFIDDKPCSWSNERGIYSIDATYRVADVPCPEPPDPCPVGLPIASSFSGSFTRGIMAENSVYLPRNIEVNGVDFYQSGRGILFSNIKNSLVINNFFEVLDAPSFNCYGIYLEDCENYHIENNDFTTWSVIGYDENSPYNAGIYVANNSNAVTEIYRNFFEDLEAGVRIQTNNKKLQLKCNTMSQIIRRHDFYITNTGELGDQGKCLGTGSDEEKMRAPAGNIFSHDCYGSEGDFKIFSGHPGIKYKHHENTAYIPQAGCYTNSIITLYPCGGTDPDDYPEINPCPSKLPVSGGGTYLMAGGPTEYMKSELENLNSAIEELTASLTEDAIALESSDDLQYLTDEKEMLLEDLVSVYLQGGETEAAIEILSAEELNWAKQNIVEIYTLYGNYAAAKEALNSVNAEEEKAADFISLYADVLIPAGEAGRNLLQLTEKETGILQELAGKQSPSGVAAENILEFLNQADYPEVFDAETEEELRTSAQMSSVSIYPNPASGELFIEIINSESDDVYFATMYDITGVIRKNIILQNNNINTIPLQEIPSGFYLIKIDDTHGETILQKLIKQ